MPLADRARPLPERKRRQRPVDGSKMVNKFLEYRVSQLRHSILLLRETIERRYPPDSVIEERVTDIELEVSMLVSQLNKEK
jgi:hypothetical protein